MPQYAILRFAKHKGAPSGALEAHHEREKERYASNPDIDTERSKYATSTSLSQRNGIPVLSNIELKHPAVVQERTAQGLWIR